MVTLSPTFETPMGRIDAQLTLTNTIDQARAEDGEIEESAVRSITIDNALVDTGATTICLPADLIAQLGLRVREEVPISTATGLGTARIFRAVELTVMSRSGTFDVLELPIGTIPLLGVIPLEALGIELDLHRQRLRLLPLDENNTYFTVL